MLLTLPSGGKVNIVCTYRNNCVARTAIFICTTRLTIPPTLPPQNPHSKALYYPVGYNGRGYV